MKNPALQKSFFHAPCDHTRLFQEIKVMENEFDSLCAREICRSILGRSIPVLTLGHGKRHFLYVGAHHGMEWITSTLLLAFLRDFLWKMQGNQSFFGKDASLFCSSYTIHILPMLNPDGVEYQQHGILENNLLFERVKRMNGGDTDLSRWQANARGVDLNHNYNAGFWEYKKLEEENQIPKGAPTRYSGLYPESEPETAGLCRYLRFFPFEGVLTLHTQGEEIYYGNSISKKIADRIAKYTGYTSSTPEGLAAYGGLTDYCTQKLHIPSFTIECGRGENPLPLSDGYEIYRKLRKMLFLFPTFF